MASNFGEATFYNWRSKFDGLDVSEAVALTEELARAASSADCHRIAAIGR